MTTPQPIPTVPIDKVSQFEDFYRLFQEKPGIYKYLDKINKISSKRGNTLVFLYEDLLSFDSQIAEMLRNDPEALIKDAIEAFKNVLMLQSGHMKKQKYFIRISTKDEKSPLSLPLRGLRAKHIDKLVWFNGITIRSSTVRPKLINAEFECNLCGTSFDILQLTSNINWPRFCTNKRCKAKAQSDFRLISKRSEFIDWQSIVIQEIPEDLPAGRIPRSVQAILTYDDLVDSVKPGDRVKVMGLYKSVLAQSIKSNNSTLFKSFIEVNYIDPEDKSEGDIELTKEERKKIEELSKEPMIQKKIARSIAPTIYGREDLKMACALSLFAGTRRKRNGGGYTRGDIHVLFVGDPGTGKSEILKSAVEKSPRGLYTSGKGSSAVGLTAAVIKDSETGQMNLEAGAIVLANGGVAAIDEFDKMDSADRSAIHEGMEQQTVSIAKAGIVATLKSQTAIMAAANPHSGRFNEYKSFAENVRLPPPLLSRFDLIFKVVDKPNPAKDAQMAEFILNNATPDIENNSKKKKDNKDDLAPINGDLLKKYIRYAKRSCHPFLSEEAKDKIKSFYLELRGQYDSEDAIVSILARNLEGLIRLSEAHAKMALKNEASKEDVEEIIKLFNRYLKDTGYDKETGKFDIDMIITGQPRTKINKFERFLDKLKEMFEENNWQELDRKGIIQILEFDDEFDRTYIEISIDELIKEGTLYEPKNGKIKFTTRES
jgi:replicative DNA helicase Mcm